MRSRTTWLRIVRQTVAVQLASSAPERRVFQPKYAAYLNLIEPWWEVLRSLALKGGRFETWEQVTHAVEAATEYWNQHRHPFIWGRRRRHKPRRQPGSALVAKAA